MLVGDGKVHSKFTLNGTSYSANELRQLAYSLIKEGARHEVEIGEFLLRWLDSEPIIQVRTSGSTGTPKIIELQKQHMVNSALATADFFGLSNSTNTLLCLPASYIAGKMMLLRAMVLGWELDYVAPSSCPLEHISKNYDFCAMVPLQLENSLDHIEQIKTLIVGGANVSKTLKTKVQSKSTAIYETYGMTETCTHVAIKSIKSDSTSGTYKQHHFQAMPNVTFSTDQRDCLVISAPKVSETKVITNDLIKLISATEFEWLGRYDNVINSGGVKLFPEQIEAKLEAHINSRFFVSGVPDEKLGEKLVLIIEGHVDVKGLMQELSASTDLKKFEIPKQIFTLPQFTETKTGKIRRKENLRLISS